jgi:hypothetical protein
MENKKTYCGSGKKQSETWMKATINVDKIKDHIQEFKGSRFVKININLKEADQYGKDVSISIDTWKPEKPIQKKEEKPAQDKTDDLPF